MTLMFSGFLYIKLNIFFVFIKNIYTKIYVFNL